MTDRQARAGSGGAPSGDRPVRVFLLDDHELVRRGLRETLSDAGGIGVVGEAGSAAEAIRRIPALRPDVALLDVRLPDGSGIEVCREIRSRDPDIHVLMLTSFDDADALFASILAGASGYVLKQIRGTALVDAVRRVATGQSLLDPVMTGEVLEHLRRPRATDARLASLTGQERRVLDLLADGLTNRQIGDSLSISEKTVKNHVTSLMAKLGVERRTQAALYRARADRERR